MTRKAYAGPVTETYLWFVPDIGKVIAGKYLLREIIGEGSMGSVWRAVHQALDRPFAVKFLKQAGKTAERLEERFFREARLAACFRHRFVVDIVDFGSTDEGTPYMVMELLTGESLAERMRRQPPLPLRELVKYMTQVLAGLDAVHQAGVVHRDLKPENIMLVRDGEEIIPKLVDFGVSGIEPGRLPVGPDGTKLTSPGSALGTPWYMSPEQALAAQDLDRRTDVYSAGVVLYEAITGKLPYDDPSLFGLLQAVAYGGAPALLALRPEIDPELSDLVARAMSVDRNRRFSAARELGDALHELHERIPEEVTCPVRSGSSLVRRVPATRHPSRPPGSIGSPGPAASVAERRAGRTGIIRPGSPVHPMSGAWVAAGLAAALGTAAFGLLRLSDPFSEEPPVTREGVASAEALGERRRPPLAQTISFPPKPAPWPVSPATVTRTAGQKVRVGRPRPHLVRSATALDTRAARQRLSQAPPETFRHPGF